jgi:hypothetical protein
MAVQKPVLTWSARRWHGVRSQILTLQVAPSEYTIAPQGRLRDSRPPLLLLGLLSLLSCLFSFGKFSEGLSHALVPVEMVLEVVVDVEDSIHSVPPGLSMALPIVQWHVEPRKGLNSFAHREECWP